MIVNQLVSHSSLDAGTPSQFLSPTKSILNRIIMSLLDKLLFNIYKCKHVFIVLLLILLCRRPSCFAAIHCYRPPLHLKMRNKKSKDATGPSTVSGRFQMGSLVACGLRSLITTVAIINTVGGDVDEKKNSFLNIRRKQKRLVSLEAVIRDESHMLC